MDSFYDAPRRPPEPLSRDMLTAVPLVPEISVLCSSNIPRNAFTPYSQWKKEQDTLHRNFEYNKENINRFTQNHQQNNSILKKQVRFQSSTLQPEVKPIFDRNTDKPLNRNDFPKENQREVPNFEQMYLANIPNRQLDLSVIDLSSESNTKRENNDIEVKGKGTPKTYREFLKSQPDMNNILLNDSITDIFNYQKSCLVPKMNPNSNVRLLTNTDICELNQINSGNYIPVKKDNLSQCLRQVVAQNAINMPKEIGNNNLDILNSPIATSISFNHKLFPNASQEQCEGASDKSTNRDLNKSNYKDYYKGNEQEAYSHEFHTEKFQNKCEFCTTIENNALKSNSVEDFTIKDLLKIIAEQSKQITQQNEQLLLLQHQVNELIAIKRGSNVLHMPRNGEGFTSRNLEMTQDKCITSTQHGEPKVLGNLKRNELPNFSVGMTTSFEVSFRRTNQKSRSDFRQKLGPIETGAAGMEKYHQIAQKFENENSNKETLMDASMVFQEPISVREPCPSPEPSININMNDFEDSDLDEESTQFEASFYRDLMEQVNKILQKAQIETTEKISCNMASSCLNDKTMYKVKEATLKYLRRIGVNLPNTEDFQSSSSSNGTDKKCYDQEDINFAVKQLLMKYLPAKHLAKFAVKERQPGDPTDFTPTKEIGIIKKRPEFSFATIQYMKKYNLIASSQKDCNQCPRPISSQSPKILDITKLKQQPKLL